MAQARAPDLYKKLLQESDVQLAVLEASDGDICATFECNEVEPRVVKKLVALAREDKRLKQESTRSSRDLTLNAVSAVIALAALVVSVISLRRSKHLES